MSGRWFELVSGSAGGVRARIARAGLSALSLPYAAASGLRKWLYFKGILHSARAPLPVISVGNIVAGGAGKTPLVERLARELALLGLRPAVVMRGYGRTKGGTSDEAALLRAKLGDAACVIEDADRLRGCALARSRGAHVALLDDGFQHLAIARDLDIVALDATNPFGFGRLLPAGLLREPPSALGRASAIVITRADLVSAEALEALRTRLKELSPRAFIAESVHRPAALIEGSRRLRPEELAGRRIVSFCGIGNPGAFEKTLERLGAELVLTRRFPDHHRFTPEELARLLADSRGAGAQLCVTTQKDFVRLSPGDWPAGDMPLAVLAVELEFVRGGQELVALVEEIARREAQAAP